MSIQEEINQIGINAKQASRELARLSSRKKNIILEEMAKCLDQKREVIKIANAKDLDAA